MTTPEALTALADRVEREEPSRELEADIYIALHIPAERAGRIDKLGGVVGWWPKDGPYESAIEVPPYTTSLDAAVTLVPKYCGWQVSVNKHRCEAVIGHSSRFAETGRAIARTPAAALTSASLRARAADMQARLDGLAPISCCN